MEDTKWTQRRTQKEGHRQGSRWFFLSEPVFCLLFFKMHNIQYSYDNVSNIIGQSVYITYERFKCPIFRVWQDFFTLAIICQIISSSKSHFV